MQHKPVAFCLFFHINIFFFISTSVESMLQFFYGGGHHNYARDSLYHLKSMQSLPENRTRLFLMRRTYCPTQTGCFLSFFFHINIYTCIYILYILYMYI